MKRPIENLDKLPRWAKHRIEKLEADIKYMEEKISANFKPCEYKTKGISMPISGMDYRTIPSDCVRFVTDKVECSIKIMDDGSLDVNQCGLASDGLAVFPRASNAIVISTHNRP